MDVITWKEAIKTSKEGKQVYFHHNGKTVPVNQDTTTSELRWKHFGQFGLTLDDVVNGKYTVKE